MLQMKLASFGRWGSDDLQRQIPGSGDLFRTAKEVAESMDGLNFNNMTAA